VEVVAKRKEGKGPKKSEKRRRANIIFWRKFEAAERSESSQKNKNRGRE